MEIYVLFYFPLKMIYSFYWMIILKLFANDMLHSSALNRKLTGYIIRRSYHTAGFTGIDDPYEPPLNCEVRTYE